MQGTPNGARIEISPELLAGYSDTTTKQFYLESATGKAMAGGGNIILSASGINIFGLDNALTTRATETGTIQCYIGADGKIYAGGGAVILDKDGEVIKGQFLKFKNTDGVDRGWLYGGANFILVSTDTNLELNVSAGRNIIVSADFDRGIVPFANNNCYVGSSSLKWNTIYRTNEASCPLPTSNTALDVFKKIKAPKIDKLDYGERHYFKDEDFPKEMKFINDEGKTDIELTRTLGVCVQAIRELIEKVNALEARC